MHKDPSELCADIANDVRARLDHLTEEVRGLAERVKASSKVFKMRPLNAYYRRLVHNALVDESGIETHSPDSRERLKRIEVRLKGGGEGKE